MCVWAAQCAARCSTADRWAEMNGLQRFLGHFTTVTRHRHRVIAHCAKAGILWQGLFHDLSKYSPTEFIPGVLYYQGTRSPNERERELFGYSQNGSIDKPLWDKINQIYATVLKNCIFATAESENAMPYPNTILNIGSSGDSVRYIQSRINTIHGAIPYIPKLTVDGLYGSATANAVGRLQRVFGLTETATVNESTHLLVNYIYAAVINGCLPSGARAAFAKSEVVREIKVSELKDIMRQNGINVGSGPIFGIKSRRALADWQSSRGLEPTGLPDKATRSELLKNKM